MKAPPPSIESYMQAMMKQGAGPASAVPSMATSIATSAAQAEVNKLRQLQAKKQELQQQMQSIDAQILKVQGALEVLQTLGIVTRG